MNFAAIGGVISRSTSSNFRTKNPKKSAGCPLVIGPSKAKEAKAVLFYMRMPPDDLPEAETSKLIFGRISEVVSPQSDSFNFQNNH